MSEQARIQELSTLDAEQIARVRAMAAASEQCDGVAPLGEQPLLALSRRAPEISHFLVLFDDDIAGYAQTTDTDDASTAEFVIDPDYRCRGGASALIKHLLDRFEVLQFWAHGNLSSAARLAARFGLEQSRELVVMSRTKDSAPPVSMDPGREDVEVIDVAEAYRRYGRDAVDPAILRVNNAAFSWHPEQGGWSLEQLRERMSVSWFDPHGFFVATEPEPPLRIVGFHWTKVHPAHGDQPRLGEVYVVGVDPSAQGRRLGTMLTAVGIAYLENQGIEEVVLYVEGDNVPALRAYESLGFQRAKTDMMYSNKHV